jgi:hypothetical protein
LGQGVTFVASIDVQSPGDGMPTGTLQFQMDGSSVGSPVNVSISGGVATASLTIPLSVAGTHQITATYNGDANFSSSTGNFTQMVQGNSTSTANVTIMLNPATGLLSIMGDGGNDAFTVMQSSPGLLQIAGINTLINQSSSPATYMLSSISAIAVSLFNGNESVSMKDIPIAGTLSIVAGSGSDSLTLDTITANVLNLSAAGPGADSITLNNLTLGSATVVAGANAILALSGWNSAGAVMLTAGNNATVSVNDLTALGDLDLTVGDNTQAVTVKESTANTLNIHQTGSTGSPLFDLEYDTLNNLMLQAGNGNNRLVFSHLKVAIQLIASLGNGTNTLTADHVTALFGLINGGPSGTNLYTDGGGNLGLIVIDFIPR